MKKTLSITAFVVIAAFAMTTLAPQSFAQGKGNNKSNGFSNGKAYGHFIAPGWLKKYERPSLIGVTLPPGIAKKIHNGGGNGNHDTTAPVISNINTDTTSTRADITWNTNESAKSKVYVSTSSPVNATSTNTLIEIDSDFETSHDASFGGLSPSTTYYALIKVTDKKGNTRTSSQFSFTTDVTPDTTDPIITNVVVGAGSTTATVNWLTNEPATSIAYLSTTTGFGIGNTGVVTLLNLSLTNSHTLMFTGLTASTTYYLRVKSVDALLNDTLSNQITFSTL